MKIIHAHGPGHSLEFLLFVLIVIVASAAFFAVKSFLDGDE